MKKEALIEKNKRNILTRENSTNILTVGCG